MQELTFKEEIQKIIALYVQRVGVVKATDESLYILGKLSNTKSSFIGMRAGRVFAVAKFRIMVLEYLYGDGDDEEKRLLNAAKDYLHVSQRTFSKSQNK